MILQTGFRTDIPAFYSKWFANRLSEGFALVRNPYNPQFVTKYYINPHVVDLIGFCTKNPSPMFPYFPLLESYRQFWFVTITPYGKDIEPFVPNKQFVVKSFQELSKKIGIDNISWRYDPIFISEHYTVERHIKEFQKMAELLCGYTKSCVISFIDLYAKVLRNFPEARSVTPSKQVQIATAFAEIGLRYGIQVKGCAEKAELVRCGLDMNGCFSKEVAEKAFHGSLNIPKRSLLRPNKCSCIGGGDIGAYNSCGHRCRYCYATSDANAYYKNQKQHDPYSPLLIGHILPTDKIHVAIQESWAESQTDLFR